MKAIILAAGYATRLYPLTIDTPKALLPIAGQAILDFITDEIETIPAVSDLILVSNQKFYQSFLTWAQGRKSRLNIKILNDGTTDDTNKLGAVGDIRFAIDTCSIDDDILVMAGDNIFTFRLLDYYNYYEKIQKDMILVTKIQNKEDLKRMANVFLDEKGKVTGMEEKPAEPKSEIAAFASYIYQKDTLPLIRKYLDEGNNPDAPGFFPSWLYRRKDVYAYEFQGECYDIGTPEAYREVNGIFEKRKEKQYT